MHHVRQHRSIHLSVFRPIGAMQIWDIEVVALIAPTFIKDLFEFLFRIKIHPQVYVEPALGGLRWHSIGINDEKRRRRRPATRWSVRAAAQGCAIDQLMTIGADIIGSNTTNERRSFTIAESIANQIVSAAKTSLALGGAAGFEIEHGVIRSG